MLSLEASSHEPAFEQVTQFPGRMAGGRRVGKFGFGGGLKNALVGRNVACRVMVMACWEKRTVPDCGHEKARWSDDRRAVESDMAAALGHGGQSMGPTDIP